jgi:ATP-dependent RNA helicase HelY
LPDGGPDLEAKLAALALPDVDAMAAAHREARRSELAPRLAEAARRVAAARAARRELEQAVTSHPSHTCPNRHQHHEALREAERTREAAAEVRATIGRLTDLQRNRTRQTLRSIQRVLEGFGYLKRGHVTAKGGALRDVFDPNGLIICEALDRGLFNACNPAELAEVLSWFAYDREQGFPNRHGLHRRLLDLRARLEVVEAEVLRAEADAGLRLSTGFSRGFYGMALAWCQGATFDEVLSRVTLAEGDVMLTFNKTLDLMRQLRDMLRKNAPEHPLLRRLAAAEDLMRRGIVEQCCKLVGT